MAWLTADFAYFAFWFVVILTVLVFVHEFGHYLVARWKGVRSEAFSIGLGPAIFGRTDRAGPWWTFSAIPLGGDAKMFGDADPASMPSGQVQEMSAAERAVSFHHKRLMQRVAVVSAGPLANFVFAIVLLTGLYATVGQSFTPPDVGAVTPKSAAAAGGIKPGDVILSINGQRIERFEDVQRIVRLDAGVPLTMKVRRGNEIVTLSVTPRLRPTAFAIVALQLPRSSATATRGVMRARSRRLAPPMALRPADPAGKAQPAVKRKSMKLPSPAMSTIAPRSTSAE